MNHWSECINIWHVTSFSHGLIKEYIWQTPSERYRPIGPLVSFSWFGCIDDCSDFECILGFHFNL